MFLSTTRGAINFLIAVEHQTGYTFHTLMEGGRVTSIVAQAIQRLIEFRRQHQLVVGEIHFDNEGALQGRTEVDGALTHEAWKPVIKNIESTTSNAGARASR